MFGTDGVRGVANQELTSELALKLGRAGAFALCQNVPGGHLVIGRDTRASGDMLEAALIAGICSTGVNVLKVGVVPTPAVAYLCRTLGAMGGIVISASHNPVIDNGIKFFDTRGFKLTDEKEEEIERLMYAEANKIPVPVAGEIGRVYEVEDAAERYINFLKDAAPVDLTGLKIVVDGANGAASQIAPVLLLELGAEVVPIYCNPNGVNINAVCGSTYPASLQEKVIVCEADLGLAYDGDADRLIAVDKTGEIVDGDQIMVICANQMHKKGVLAKNTVVVTVMSNLGLHLALKKNQIKVIETKVGDRYVLEGLLNFGANFGGEQSGHIIFLNHSPTGDGILTSLKLLSEVKENGTSLKELADQMERLPQILENVPVRNKQQVMASPALEEAIWQKERLLAGNGRILVRPSGTEEVVRIMVEGRDIMQLREIVNELTAVAKRLVF
ncbi:MAG: phosphoglucosamine mutase [Peptococcaceae bacterium]